MALRSTACTGMMLMVLGQSALEKAAVVDVFLLGAWARSVAACSRPELTFAGQQVSIEIDADGLPVTFPYSNIMYSATDQDIIVKLNGRHPYGKTRDHEKLHFRRIDINTIDLMKTKGKRARFIRCAKLH